MAALFMSRPNAVASFEKANAYSPQTSRRPESLKVRRKLVKKAVDKGLLVAVGDGRYYLDRDAMKRADRKKMIMIALVVLTFLPLLWMMW